MSGVEFIVDNPFGLTPSQVRVIRLHILEGLSYKEIALKLHISTSTVRTHMHNSYVTMGVGGGFKAQFLWMKEVEIPALTKAAAERGYRQGWEDRGAAILEAQSQADQSATVPAST